MNDLQQSTPPPSKLLAYLQLVRLPALFTALADIFLGFLLVQGTLQPLWDFGWLLTASTGLYLSGMVFNDLFDRQIDAKQRPGRPIPSGRISVSQAAGLGTVLMFIGVGAAFLVGSQSGFIAAMIVAAVLGYDGFFKKTALGPLMMGSCRFLNVMLGSSTAAELWKAPQLGVAMAFGLYISGVTWFARSEADTTRRRRFDAIFGVGIVNFGIMLLVAFLFSTDGLADRSSVIIFLFVIGLVINRRLSAAVFDPAPQKIGSAIKTMLLSLPMIDAGLILYVTGRPVYALCVAALLLPAILLARRIPMT